MQAQKTAAVLSAPGSVNVSGSFLSAAQVDQETGRTVEIVDAIPRGAATKVNRGALVVARGG
jgi:hypothetical protein